MVEWGGAEDLMLSVYRDTAGDLWWLQSVREVKSCKPEEGRFGFYLAVCIALLICGFTCFWHLNS